MEFYIVGITEVEPRDAIVRRYDLMINSTFKNSDTAEHEMPFVRVRHIARVIDI